METEEDLLKKHQENPKDTKAIYDLAIFYIKTENYGQAQKYFESLVSIEPKLFDAYNGLGFALQRQEKWIDAIKTYQKGLKLDAPKTVLKDSYLKLKIGSYKNIATCHLKINEPQHTIACYNIIAKLDPSISKEMEAKIEAITKLRSLKGGSQPVLY
jgi:tetratricopeptide (TPR) repeat protein